MPAERFDFPNAKGEQLAALLDRPDGPIRAVALFAHCFTCGKNNLAAVRIGRALARAGIGMLRFDFAGLGASGGDSGLEYRCGQTRLRENDPGTGLQH